MSPSAIDTIDRETIAATAARIAGYLRHTPVVTVDAADFGVRGAPITLKLEQLQHAGSFKTRGAFARLTGNAIPAAGVVAASGGNHGAAVAYAAMKRGVPATIFVPTISSPAKTARIRAYGAQLEIGGANYDDALVASEAFAARSGALQAHAFDQPETLLGQGTLAMELAEQAPALDTVLVGVGGGGLLGGIAAWYGGTTRVIGVEPDGAPTLTRAFAAGEPVDAPAGSLAADSLAPRRIGALGFAMAQRYVERVVLVDDDAIWTYPGLVDTRISPSKTGVGVPNAYETTETHSRVQDRSRPA